MVNPKDKVVVISEGGGERAGEEEACFFPVNPWQLLFLGSSWGRRCVWMAELPSPWKHVLKGSVMKEQGLWLP